MDIENLRKTAKKHLRGFKKNYSKAAYYYQQIIHQLYKNKDYPACFKAIEKTIGYYLHLLETSSIVSSNLLNALELFLKGFEIIPLLDFTTLKESIAIFLSHLYDHLETLFHNRYQPLDEQQAAYWHYMAIFAQYLLYTSPSVSFYPQKIKKTLTFSTRQFHDYLFSNNSTSKQGDPPASRLTEGLLFSQAILQQKYANFQEFIDHFTPEELFLSMLYEVSLFTNKIPEENYQLLQTRLKHTITADYSVHYDEMVSIRDTDQQLHFDMNKKPALKQIDQISELLSHLTQHNLPHFHQQLQDAYPDIKYNHLIRCFNTDEPLTFGKVAEYLHYPLLKLVNLLNITKLLGEKPEEHVINKSAVIGTKTELFHLGVFDYPPTVFQSIHEHTPTTESDSTPSFFPFPETSRSDSSEPDENFYCPYCGHALPPNAQHCKYCDQPL